MDRLRHCNYSRTAVEHQSQYTHDFYVELCFLTGLMKTELYNFFALTSIRQPVYRNLRALYSRSFTFANLPSLRRSISQVKASNSGGGASLFYRSIYMAFWAQLTTTDYFLLVYDIQNGRQVLETVCYHPSTCLENI